MTYQREGTGHYRCPACGSQLTSERDLLRCDQHGEFFAYGPHLLVRAPRNADRLPDTLLPWENGVRRQER